MGARGKTVYLNKSTTRYVIIGNDPVDFSAVVCICDRVTGSHVTIPKGIFGSFLSHLQATENGTFSLDSILDGVSIILIRDVFWISTDKGTVSLGRISVENLLRIGYLVMVELQNHHFYKHIYKNIVESYREMTANMNLEKTCEFLQKTIRTTTIAQDADEYTVLFDLITNRDYLITLDTYKDFFGINNKQ